MRYGLILLSFTILLGFMHAQGSAQVSAQVSVGCPFYASMNANSTYPLLGNVILSYTVKTQAVCTITNMAGNIVIEKGSNIIVSNAILIPSVSNTPITTNVILNTNSLSNGTYSATVSLSGQGISNSSAATFSLLNPPNIIITGINFPQSVQLGAQATLALSLENTGQYASTNDMLYLSVNGPVPYSNSYSVSGLAPGQQTNITITLSSITSATGNYKLSVYDQYAFDNSLYDSQTANSSYHVSAPAASSGGFSGGFAANITAPVSQIQNFFLTAAPFIVSASSASPSIAMLRSVNTGTVPENVTLSVPMQYSSLIAFDPPSGYLAPKQQFDVQVVATPNAAMSEGTYAIPINISVVSGLKRTTRQNYLLLDVYVQAKRGLQAINFVSLSNNTGAENETHTFIIIIRNL